MEQPHKIIPHLVQLIANGRHILIVVEVQVKTVIQEFSARNSRSEILDSLFHEI